MHVKLFKRTNTTGLSYLQNNKLKKNMKYDKLASTTDLQVLTRPLINISPIFFLPIKYPNEKLGQTESDINT